MPAFNVEDGVEKRFCLAVLMNTFPSMPNPAAVVAAERTVLRVPSLPNWIEPTVEYLKDKAVLCGACAATRARKLVVALQEALSNSIVDGNLEITSDLKERSDDAFTQALAVRAAAHEAVAHDLSAEGIGILQTGLAVNDRILVGINKAGTTVYVPAEVRHWRTLADNVVELGCHLQPQARAAKETQTSRELSAAIEAIMGKHVSPPLSADERRSHPRIAYTARIGIHERAGAEPTYGFGRDLSKGGMAFISTVPLTFTTKVLSLPRGSGGEALHVRARVVRCTQIMGGFYDVGVQFVELEPDVLVGGGASWGAKNGLLSLHPTQQKRPF